MTTEDQIRKYTEIQNFLSNRRETLISTEYIDEANKLTVKCVDDHQYLATGNQILHQHIGCPICKTRRFRKIVREYDLRFVKDNKQCIIKMDFEDYFDSSLPNFEVNRKKDLIISLAIISAGITLIRLDYTQLDDNKEYHIDRALGSNNGYYFSTPEMYRHLSEKLSEPVDADVIFEEDRNEQRLGAANRNRRNRRPQITQRRR